MPGLSPQIIHELVHLKVCFHSPEGGDGPELAAPTVQRLGGMGAHSTPIPTVFC